MNLLADERGVDTLYVAVRGTFTLGASPRLADAISCIRSGAFSPDDTDRFSSIVEALLGFDTFMVAADFDAYWVPRGWDQQAIWPTRSGPR